MDVEPTAGGRPVLALVPGTAPAEKPGPGSGMTSVTLVPGDAPPPTIQSVPVVRAGSAGAHGDPAPADRCGRCLATSAFAWARADDDDDWSSVAVGWARCPACGTDNCKVLSPVPVRARAVTP